MKKILLCCSAGMSTSILVKKMMNYFDDNDIDMRVEAMGISQAESIIDKFDVVLVAPQMAHAIEEVSKMTSVIVKGIPGEIYQTGSGKEVALLALELLKNEI